MCSLQLCGVASSPAILLEISFPFERLRVLQSRECHFFQFESALML
jgi:hypothetical protein